MKATAVIGACFGDEGKGLLTDYLCSQSPSIICRFNGGANAGHTVVTPDGKRHVFHHFGAGTFADAPTYLSRFFIVNPLLWNKERWELPARIPRQFIHWDAPLTVPYDMMVNQEIERQRGSSRHGSCGVGVNEAVTRCKAGLVTTVSDMQNVEKIRFVLNQIKATYLPGRIAQLNLKPSDEFFELVNSPDVVQQYIDACYLMLNPDEVTICGDGVLSDYEHVVFEGAQGLLLDEDHEFFPHVTRSKTGLTNIMQIAPRVGIAEIDAIYVTRSYMTRHGAGPFPTEDPAMRFDDETNAPNDWQGTLRFGEHDTTLMADAIIRDLRDNQNIPVSASIALTHLDQSTADEYLENDIKEKSGVKVLYKSTGPTREHIQTYAMV